MMGALLFKSAVIFTILCSICFAQVQSVALSGTVKLSSGTPVEGVTVSLAGFSSLSTLTKADGTFSLKKDISRVTSVPSTPLSWHFTLQENSILFTPVDMNVSLDVSVYTNDGRIITSRTVTARSGGNNRVTLPTLGSGVYYLAVKTGGKEIIHPLLQVGTKLYCKKATVATAARGTIPAANRKAAGSVNDTLIAEKNGFSTARHPLVSYEQDGIEFILEPGDGYSGSITKLSVSANPNSVLSAYVSWTTEKAANSKVQFGVDGVQWEIADENPTIDHKVLVIGMRAKTTYEIHAISGVSDTETTFTTGTLPAHIPVAEVDMNDAARVQPGWTLMNVQQGDGQSNARSNAPPTAVMYDLEGYPVWYYVYGTQNERGGAIPADRTDKGVLIGPTITIAPIEVDWAGNKIWSCSSPTCGGEQLSHHAGKLSNGNYIVQEDVGGMSDHCWREFTPGNETPVHSICLSDAVKGSGMDWAHGNSITVDLDKDIAYISTRFVGLIKAKYSTGERIWHLPASYALTHNTKYTPAANMTFVPPSSQFSDIHDPEIHDDGTILFFDNGGYTGVIEDGNPGNYHSRAVEYAIDEKAMTATLVWEWPGTFDVDEFYRTDYYVPFWGDADRLPNGNVLITAGRSSSAATTPVSRVTEVAKDDGKVVWEMRMPRKQGTDYGLYRAERVYPLPLVRAIAK